MTDVSQTERSFPLALGHARRIRDQLIDLTYELPSGTSKNVLRLWNVADVAVMEFIRALEAADDQREAG